MRALGTIIVLLMALGAGPALASPFEVVQGGPLRSTFIDSSSRVVVGGRLEFVAYTVNEPPWKGWAAVERLKVRVDCKAQTITELAVTALDETLKPLAPRPRALETRPNLGKAYSLCGIPPPPILVGGYEDLLADARTLEQAIAVTRNWMSARRGEPAGYRARFLPRPLVSLPSGQLRLVSENSSGVFFIDETRTRRTGDVVEVMELLVRHPENMGTTKMNWRYSVFVETIDCKDRTYFLGPSAMFQTDGSLEAEFPQDVQMQGVVVPPRGDVREQRIRVVCDQLPAPEGATVTGYEAAKRLIDNPEVWRPLAMWDR